MWNRKLQHKYVEIEKDLVQSRLQDWKMANGKSNNNSQIKNSQRHKHVLKPNKFQRMTLSLNKNRLELEEFHKNSLLYEKEQRREDLVLMATQQSIIDNQQIAKNKGHHKGRNQKKKLTNKSQLTSSTFFKYKQKTISVDNITSPLKKFLKDQHSTNNSDSFRDNLPDYSRITETEEDQLTQRAMENQISALKKLHKRINHNQEKNTDYSRNKQVSGLGLVKYKSIMDDSEEEEEDKEYFKQKQTLQIKKKPILLQIQTRSIQNSNLPSAQQSPSIKTTAIFQDFRTKRQSHQLQNLNHLHSHTQYPTPTHKLPQIQQSPLGMSKMDTTQSMPHINVSSATWMRSTLSQIQPKYLHGISSFPPLQKLQNQSLYQKLNGIVKELNGIKNKEMVEEQQKCIKQKRRVI